MLNYSSIADKCFQGTERTAVKAMIADFERFCPDEYSLSEKSKREMLDWCAGGGLDYSASLRRLRWCGAVYEAASLANPIRDVTYRELDFSNDLAKHYFRTEYEMLAAAKDAASKMPTVRGDLVYIIPAILDLAWNGFSQAEILALRVGSVEDKKKHILAFDGRRRKIPRFSFAEGVWPLFSYRAETASNDAPLFATQDGTPWDRSSLSNIIFRANKVASNELSKEFVLPKLEQNGLFANIRAYREEMHTTIDNAVSYVLGYNTPRWRKRHITNQGYEHWEKYYY